MKTKCGQADKAENCAGSEGAFKAVGGVVLEIFPGDGQESVKEPREAIGLAGEATEGARVGFLPDFGIDFGKDSCVGNADGEDAANGIEAYDG
jgi:hypothetical protein